MSFAFKKTPRISCSYKLLVIPVQYQEHEYGLFKYSVPQVKSGKNNPEESLVNIYDFFNCQQCMFINSEMTFLIGN